MLVLDIRISIGREKVGLVHPQERLDFHFRHSCHIWWHQQYLERPQHFHDGAAPKKNTLAAMFGKFRWIESSLVKNVNSSHSCHHNCSVISINKYAFWTLNLSAGKYSVSMSCMKHHECLSRASVEQWMAASSLVREDGWLSGRRVYSDYVIRFGNHGGCHSQLCVFSLQGFTHLISIWYMHGHTHTRTLYADRHSYTHKLLHTSVHLLQHIPSKACCQTHTSEAPIESWEMALTVTLTAIGRQNTFEGFYEVWWQRLSADKLLSVSVATLERSKLLFLQ